MMFTHLLLRLASMPLTPTPPNVNLTLTVQWVGMDGFPKFPKLASVFAKRTNFRRNTHLRSPEQTEKLIGLRLRLVSLEKSILPFLVGGGGVGG